MKGLLVPGEEHSQSVSPLRGRAVLKAGPRFHTAKEMPVWGRGGGEGRKENTGHWPKLHVWCAHKKCIHADCITGMAGRYYNSRDLTMTSRDRPGDGEWSGAEAISTPWKSLLAEVLVYTGTSIGMNEPARSGPGGLQWLFSNVTKLNYLCP